MQDLSLHLIDIAENSIRAQATQITIEMSEYPDKEQLILKVKDNGKGMSKQLLMQATDPFVTTKMTRRVGLGLALLEQNCKQSDGDLKITSSVGKGTIVTATMAYHHINRLPLGDLAGSLALLIVTHPRINWAYRHTYEGQTINLDEKAFSQILGDCSSSQAEQMACIKNELVEKIEALRGFYQE